MKTLALAWRQLRRDLVAGDVRILFAALVLAVVAVTAVGFVTDRAERMLAAAGPQTGLQRAANPRRSRLCDGFAALSATWCIRHATPAVCSRAFGAFPRDGA